jgi:hypothetical protein
VLGTGPVDRPAPARRVLRPPLGADGLIGFGEAYLTGAWDAEDLGGFLTVLAADVAHLVPQWMQKLRASSSPRARRHRNTRRPQPAATSRTTTTSPTTSSRCSSTRR